MSKSFSYSLVGGLLLASLAHALEAPRAIALNAREQAALGVQFAPLQSASQSPLLLTASVTTPPGREAIVSAPYAGMVSRLNVGIGDNVKAGTALAGFTSAQLSEARRQLNEARLEQRSASAALERETTLLAEGIIPAARVQLSRTRLETAQALVASRAAELRASGLGEGGPADAVAATGTLRSPISGQVSEAVSAIGQRVDAGTVLFRLHDTSQLQLDIPLSASRAARLKAGDEVLIPERNARARIVAVSRSLDASQSARARASVYQRGSLQVGEMLPVSVQAGAAGSGQAALWQVPARSLSQWRGAPVIFVRTYKGISAHPVRIVSSNDDQSVIEAPLAAGNQLAVSGVASLRALLQRDE